MTPLFIVGILLISPALTTPEADLKTKCQNDPNCYWWTGQDSPFKKASIKGAHIKSPVSFNNGNPFFNGAFENLPPNAGFSNQGEKVDLSKNPFFNKDQKPLFPTAHPSQIVGNEQQKPDYSKNPFLQNMYTANGSQLSAKNGFIGVQPKPFSTKHPLEGQTQGKFGDDDEYTLSPSSYTRKCQGDDFVCVPVNQCPNGVLPDYISNSLQVNTNVPCDLRSNACCKISNSKSQEVNVQFKGNNTFITAGKSSVPESLIKFGGVPGFSPGLIQVLPVEINNAGEFGSSHQGESTQKPAREISGSSSNNVFGSTPDYSNYNFEDVRFASSIQGPAYLPPLNGPTPPSVASPDLEVPVSTYVPSFPTQRPTTRPTPKPFIPSYSPSINNQYVTPKPKQPFIQDYLPPSTPKPYVPPITRRPTPPQYRPQPSPSSPFPSQKPYTPVYKPPTPQKPYTPYVPVQTIPTQKPYRPSYIPPSPKPTTSREYLPPPVPTSSSNVNNQYRPFPSTQKPYNPPSTIRPRPPPTFIPQTTKSEYLPPRTPAKVKPYQPTYQPSSLSPFTSPSYRPTPGYSYQPPATTPRPKPTVIYQTSPSIPQSTYSKVTPGYTYEKPTPAYTYPKPTPGYTYPKPTPSFGYPTRKPQPTTQRPLIPSSTFNIQSTYRPSPTFINTQKTSPRPQPTAGYEYPKPTPEFNLPTGSPTSISPTYRPYPTTQRPRTRPTQYLPPSTPPQPTPGYNYPKPTPTFGYPDIGAPSSTNNQYIPPPQDKEGSDTSDTSVKVRPRPEPRPDQTIQNENVIPPAACAAALKCVQEIYCTAEGVVSPVPVVLTKEQALSRVPTTVCRDIGSGTTGVCCRDPNYKDPWPSANLVNGFDDGQYKEDDSIGQYNVALNDIAQYRSDLSRPSRSSSGNSRRSISSELNGSNGNLGNQEETCGVRHQNTSPKGPGPLNTNFAEIPWQAMILRDSNRSLLCGGAIIRRNAVLTNAHCVEGLPTSDILVKGGEWKLGIDEEPLPFQIVKVSVIVKHPGYKPGSLVNDLALLILEEKLRPAKNIGTICLPEPNKIPTRNCIATGWGKRILQLHAKGAVMRSVGVNIMDNEQCRDTLRSTYQDMMPNYSPNTLCGFSEKDQCKVDYGSALACTNDQSRYILSGIYSWDTGCKDQNQIGGYVAPDVEWINDCLSKPVKVLKKLPTAQ
ncbi:probable serine/threonine-protein kinase nek3 [Harmonia axyridis]|uniref:probable serine/threonine-protein kinase nek3 n=1 Tax=Harmonia axyridis TaxID=115357 RepID=UPI001E2795D1|nr:probable serine/threonine-protein kinase nek3 [Harmonia axyridis]